MAKPLFFEGNLWWSYLVVTYVITNKQKQCEWADETSTSIEQVVPDELGQDLSGDQLSKRRRIIAGIAAATERGLWLEASRGQSWNLKRTLFSARELRCEGQSLKEPSRALDKIIPTIRSIVG